ncbi:Fur family transcriptional regulator [Conexibacter sp. JD483]|uniref:Fur family transcriptional regulator n=1 Tax=unclassified Conexibacter TaxID=2627773 RepID=UPI00271EE45E|nr:MULTISPECIES: Fur family transcriptional regulator [unclassified Conexibacter]MDO8183957.1 Fur family transcriptional regulator [Conexibacter sp. CPCC 205706]MDO8196949.1 Fur family transcriptional regulator [Conexibacter sp. CPCC 205762]MDR9369081.1 Fur family transcriptional regulator [Conexibacter sp. JD483]
MRDGQGLGSDADASEPSAWEEWLEWAQRLLSLSGHRAGAVRIAVLELFARDGSCLLSAREVIARLDEHGVGSPASAYRLLDEFVALGLLRRVVGRDGLARYEQAHPERTHYHLVDIRTGAVRPFTDAALEQAILRVAEHHGFELDRHDIVLHGIQTSRPHRALPDRRP